MIAGALLADERDLRDDRSAVSQHRAGSRALSIQHRKGLIQLETPKARDLPARDEKHKLGCGTTERPVPTAKVQHECSHALLRAHGSEQQAQMLVAPQVAGGRLERLSKYDGLARQRQRQREAITRFDPEPKPPQAIWNALPA